MDDLETYVMPHAQYEVVRRLAEAYRHLWAVGIYPPVTEGVSIREIRQATEEFFEGAPRPAGIIAPCVASYDGEPVIVYSTVGGKREWRVDPRGNVIAYFRRKLDTPVVVTVTILTKDGSRRAVVSATPKARMRQRCSVINFITVAGVDIPGFVFLEDRENVYKKITFSEWAATKDPLKEGIYA